MPRLTPYAAHEIAMVSSTSAGSGFPIGLMPGALPSDHASRQTLNTTAMRLPVGHTQLTCCAMARRAPCPLSTRWSWPGLSRPSRSGEHRALLIGVAGTSPATTVRCNSNPLLLTGAGRVGKADGIMIGQRRFHRVDRHGQRQTCRRAAVVRDRAADLEAQ